MDEVLAARLIDAAIPGLAPSRVTYLGEGMDSAAFEVNGEWVFRFPKRPDVDQQFGREARLLAALSPSSPIPVPDFKHFGSPTPVYPFHFVGYRKLDGVPAIEIEEIEPFAGEAPALARFLSWLHSFPVGRAVELGVPAESVDEVIDAQRDEALRNFEVVHSAGPSPDAGQWLEYLRSGPPAGRASRNPVLTHNDFGPEHVLVDPATHSVTGVIDWTDAAIGHPIGDLSGLWLLGGEAWVEAAKPAYASQVTASDAVRARYLAACRAVNSIAFGVETGRPGYIAHGLRALRLCAE